MSFLLMTWSLLNASLGADHSFQGDDTVSLKAPVKRLFTSNEPLKIIIQFENLKNLKRDVGDNPSYHKATLTYFKPDSTRFVFNIKVKARGFYRKDPSHCNFPPLKVNFKKNKVGNTIFEGQNKIKLVTHCRKRPAEFNQYVLKEYLAYRIYNVLTDRSFCVRLAEIKYVDRRGKYDPITRNAFFIEDTKDMAQRNGFRHVKVNNIPQEYVDYFYQDLLTVFQYMIGNTDWSVPARHNIKLLMEKPDQRPVAVPYDFDWTGLVNPVYAKPSNKLNISSVEERLFRGYEKNPEDYYRIFELFQEKKNEIYAILEEIKLDQKHQKMAKNYLDDFYRIISNEKLVIREFVIKARSPNADYWGK